MAVEPIPSLAPLPDAVVAELADLFRLMGDATRLKIILSCLTGPASVNDIARRIDASPSLVSHHLRLLRAARILRADRRGRQVFYAPRDQHIECVIADMVTHVKEPRDFDEEQG